MIAEIIAVGTELLMGQIVNTNARYISERFPDADVYVYYHTVVGDNRGRLSECLKMALERADVIVTTGGLGPTQDDLTKETIAEVLGMDLEVDERILADIRGFFESRGRETCKNNEKQAFFPAGSTIIRNSNGTAPGCIIEKDGKTIIMLPGPPWEMEPMFEESVIPHFMKHAQYKLKSVFVRMFGIGESSMETIISDLIDAQDNPTIAPYAKRGEITLRITVKYTPGSDDPDILLKPVLDEIEKRLGRYIYSFENEELFQKTGRLLIENGLTIALAESCTGGMITSMLTNVPGISAVLDRGLVTYSYRSKVQELGVLYSTLEDYGAVSSQTACEMAQGVRESSATDIGVAVTGIAGPGGGTPEKPVGLVYIALSSEKGTEVKKLELWGGRERIRYSTCLNALDMVRRHVLACEAEDRIGG